MESLPVGNAEVERYCEW